MAVVVGQRQRLYSGVRMLTWFYLSSINKKFVINIKGSKPDLNYGHANGWKKARMDGRKKGEKGRERRKRKGGL